jgi:hypothetical protein
MQASVRRPVARPQELLNKRRLGLRLQLQAIVETKTRTRRLAA